MNKPVRHGEVLLHPIDEIPQGRLKKCTSHIVAHSETGHHHILEAEQDFEVTETQGELYIELFQPAKLVHKKSFDAHRTLTLQPAKYLVRHKQEYDPFLQARRAVWD